MDENGGDQVVLKEILEEQIQQNLYLMQIARAANLFFWLTLAVLASAIFIFILNIALIIRILNI